MKLVDSHCHLDDQKYDEDRERVIERALAAGVDRMMVIGSEGAVRLAEKHPYLYATAGVHPHEASRAGELLAWVREAASHPKVLAIGEIGLDYHYEFSPREVQRRVFEQQLAIASDAAKPIVIHTREAWSDTLALLSGWRNGGIMHCFTGDAAEAREALALGFHLGFGGVLTFPKADAVREAARIAPEDRLLVETDCPYLAPVPHRGKRNEPAFVVEVARQLAELRGTTIEEISRTTTRNWKRLCLRGEPGSG